MHDGMPYGPIQGQGHVALKVRNSSIFKIYPPPFSVGAVKWLLILKLEENIWFCSGRIFDICPSFFVTWLLNLNKSWGVDRQSRVGLIFA